MERLEFVRSRMKNSGRVLLGFLLVAMCYFLTDAGDDIFERGVAWFGLLFFGAATLVGLSHVIRGGKAFTFDPDGITDHPNSVAIPWSELKECAVVSVHGVNFLALTFRNADQFFGRLNALKRIISRLDQRMGCGHWALSFAGVSPGIDAALDFIREHAGGVRCRT